LLVGAAHSHETESDTLVFAVARDNTRRGAHDLMSAVGKRHVVDVAAGVAVESVIPGSPAAMAGLRRVDVIVGRGSSPL
jgi:S1-C subfamily serine protease